MPSSMAGRSVATGGAFRNDRDIYRYHYGGVGRSVVPFMCDEKWVIKMPEEVPLGVARAFTALIPAFVVAFTVLIINGALVAAGTDIFQIIAVPFGFVTNLTNSWLGLMVIYF